MLLRPLHERQEHRPPEQLVAQRVEPAPQLRLLRVVDAVRALHRERRRFRGVPLPYGPAQVRTHELTAGVSGGARPAAQQQGRARSRLLLLLPLELLFCIRALQQLHLRHEGIVLIRVLQRPHHC